MAKPILPENQTSSLTKMLESRGRTRGSSVAPAQSGVPLASPQPQRDIQTKLDNISNELQQVQINQDKAKQNQHPSRRHSVAPSQARHQRNQSLSSRSVVSPDNQGVRLSNHGSSSYQTTQRQNVSYSDRNDSGPSNNTSRRMSHAEQAENFLAKLAEVQSMVVRCKDLPKDLQEKLVTELQQISDQFAEQHRLIVKDLDRSKNERDELRRQLRQAQENNGRLVVEKKDLELKYKQSIERLDELEERWNRAQRDLLDQIAFQKEQIEGKRALWLEHHPGSSAKRDAMLALRDPFNSPSASQTPSYMGGAMSAMSTMTTPLVKTPSGVGFAAGNIGPPKYASSTAEVPYAYTMDQVAPSVCGNKAGSSSRRTRKNTGPPPALEMRRGGLPTGAPYRNASKMPWPPQHTIYGTHQTFHTEPGSPRASVSNALVVRKSDEEIAAEYKAMVTTLYEKIEDWVRKYARIPNENNDRAIASGNDTLWAYMMNCTYPGHRQDSHTHVVTLLNNPVTRYWFVMRMATQYCVKDIMSINAFRSYNKGVENTIDTALKKLSERGLHNEARQYHIDQSSEAIQAVLGSKNYQNFRAQQLGIHTKALRDMLGPLLDNGVTRASAGVDLGAIAVASWDLSCKMHTAHLTFQIYFPETNSKFTAATMLPKDMTHIDPVQLQIEQVRLKLVITPVITMRDDRGTTIRAKNVHSAFVLLMK